MTSLIKNCKKVGKYYAEVHKILADNYSDDEEATYNDKIEAFKIVMDTLNMYHDEIVDERLVADIVDRHFPIGYKYIKNVDHDDGASCFREYDIKYKTDEINNKEIDVPEEYLELI